MTNRTSTRILLGLLVIMPVPLARAADPEGDIVMMDPVIVTPNDELGFDADVGTPQIAKPPTPSIGSIGRTRPEQPLAGSGVGAWVYFRVIVDEEGNVAQALPTQVMIFDLTTRKGISDRQVETMIQKEILPVAAAEWDRDAVLRYLAERSAQAAQRDQLRAKWNPGRVNGEPTPFRMSVIVAYGSGGGMIGLRGPEEPVPLVRVAQSSDQ